MPRWKIACHEQLLPGASLTEKWDSARAAGFDGIELGRRVGEAFEARLPELTRALDDGLVVPAVSLDVPARAESPDHRPIPSRQVASQVRAVAALGAGVVLALAVDSLATGHPTSSDEDVAAWADALRGPAEEAAREGVLICLRPLNRYEARLVNTLDQAVALCRAVDLPSVRVAAGTFHMNIEEADPARALLEAGPWLGHVHLADSDGGRPGAGHLDWWATFAALDAAGYDGWVSVTGRPSGPALPAAVSLLRQAGG